MSKFSISESPPHEDDLEDFLESVLSPPHKKSSSEHSHCLKNRSNLFVKNIHIKSYFKIKV